MRQCRAQLHSARLGSRGVENLVTLSSALPKDTLEVLYLYLRLQVYHCKMDRQITRLGFSDRGCSFSFEEDLCFFCANQVMLVQSEMCCHFLNRPRKARLGFDLKMHIQLNFRFLFTRCFLECLLLRYLFPVGEGCFALAITYIHDPCLWVGGGIYLQDIQLKSILLKVMRFHFSP